MQYGWHEEDGNAYYLGTEDEGWRAESQWLWLEKSGNNENDLDDDDDLEVVLDCSEDDNCDDEGWYWFQSSGKAYHDTGKKKINGKYYMFNEHGQMLYEWIDGKAVEQGSNAQLDGNLAKGELATTSVMRYYNEVEDGSRGNGWYQIDGAEDLVIQTGTTSMTVKLNTLMAVPKTSLLTMMTELYTFRESKLKVNTSPSTKKVRCRMAYSTARLTADSTTSMPTAIRRLAA